MSAKQMSDTEAKLLETILALTAELESIQVRGEEKKEKIWADSWWDKHEEKSVTTSTEQKSIRD